MTTLHTHRRKDVLLADALAAFDPPKDTVALVYAPRWCGFARLVGGKLTRATGPVPADAYEVRAFHENAELRWLKDPTSAGGTGTAVILSADAHTLPTEWTSTKRELVTFNEDTTYLLWGKGTDPISVCGWGQVAEARIGGLLVPLDGIAKDARVLLHAVEYVAEDEYGSAFVCEERLTELKVSNAKG